jgi:hypothetical protein
VTEPTKELLKEIAEQAERQQAAASELIERDGRKYLIRPVTRFELASAGMRGPLLEMISGAETSEVKEKAIRMDLDKWMDLQEKVVACGLTAPAVWTGPPTKRPPGHVTLPAIAMCGDLEFIYGAVMNLSGFTVEAAQAASFPDTDEAGAGDCGDSPSGGDAPEPSGSVAPR